MALFVAAAIILVTTATTFGQTRYDNYEEKPGSCPPALPVQICSRACFSDAHCQGIGKCCPTACGGFVCSRPVTMKRPSPTEKAGSCPTVPTGRWVCSPTCSTDSDCRGAKKCCKNRCGALACQSPEVEIIESIEIPVAPNLNEPPRYPNPNSYPYYYYNN